MELLGEALGALKSGLDVRDVIAVLLVAVVSIQLTQLIKLQAETNVRLDALDKTIERNGAHQTSRMEEIRKFMVSWWERFGPLSPPFRQPERTDPSASKDSLS